MENSKPSQPSLSTEGLLSLVSLTLTSAGFNPTGSASNPEAAGLAVVAEDTGRVLMLQRSLAEDDPAAGKWEFPGGTLEEDEEPYTAALREWREETGMTIPDGNLAGDWSSANGVYQLFVYRISEESYLPINLDHEDRKVLNPDDPDGDNIETLAWWSIEDLQDNPALREEAKKTDWNVLRATMDPKMSFTLIDGAGSHYHYDPITEFYNECHSPEDGRFCSGPGAGAPRAGSGLRDSDGRVSGKTKTEAPKETGKHGASLVDPHEGTREVDGVLGYGSNDKPVPGTDAWLEAHGIAKDVFESRPYVKYEADKESAAIKEAFAEYPEAQKFFQRTAEQEKQDGGYIMYKKEAPDSPLGPVSPQVRPNQAIVTNPAKAKLAEVSLENSKKRLADLKEMSPNTLLKERREFVKQAETHLERIKRATPEKIRAEASKKVEDAQAGLAKAKKSGDETRIAEAKQAVVVAKRDQVKDERRARNWIPEKELHDANLGVTNAKAAVQRSLDDPKGALESAIKSQERTVKRDENRFKKSAAKYVFSPKVSSARIDVGNDKKNIKNLTEGKGRIYFAMEGSIKHDAILTAVRKEDPTAAVVNVPSVTLWQQKDGIENEIQWFAKTHAKGREVILIPDADGVNNPNVRAQAKGLSAALKNFGVKDVIVAAPPLKYGTKQQIDKFNLPSGVGEERKGADDHLGAGRGTLGQMQYQKSVRKLDFDLSEYTVAGGAKERGETKMSRRATKNTEAALSALSDLVGTKGAAQIPAKLLAQSAGLSKTSATDARATLERLGVIKVEHIWDKDALARRRRIRNPEVSAERVNYLVKNKIIKEPNLEQQFTEVKIDESPVISILKPKYVLKDDDIEFGRLSDRPNWSPPKSYKGWTSPITGRPDSTGIAARLKDEESRATSKKVAQTTAQRLAKKKAPAGRRLVRTAAGAARYGVPIGSPIPLAVQTVDLDPGLLQFYNRCHDEQGRFCDDDVDGPGKPTVSGRTTVSWPSSRGRKVTTVASDDDSVSVDGIEARTVYETVDSNGESIRLYDQTGEAGDHASALLNNHARMNEMYPNLDPPRRIVVTSSGDGRIDDPTTFGQVFADDRTTYVNSEQLNYDVKKAASGQYMDSSQQGSSSDYLMTHEFGHHVDFSRHVTGGVNYKPNPYSTNSEWNSYMSKYGQDQHVESYAEAFADWHHTSGKTKNPAVVALARYEGWYGTEGVQASGHVSSNEEILDSLVMGGWNLYDMVKFQLAGESHSIGVSDNFEKGKSTLIGDYKLVEPSTEEVARATRIFEEVLAEIEGSE